MSTCPPCNQNCRQGRDCPARAPKPADNEALPPLPQAEFDALLDHIYEYGTNSEGIIRRARAMCEAYARAALSASPQAPQGWKLVKSPITEQMHEAASKVLIRASGLDGTPQRVLDAMLAASPQAPAAQPVAQHFGIIDPDYARIYTQARIIAWQYGFACLAHGSFTRDLDLLLVPWTDAAQADDVDYFAPRIAEAAGLKVSPHPASDRPHGRKTWTLLLPGFAEPRWVDLSVMAPSAPPAQPTNPPLVGPADC